MKKKDNDNKMMINKKKR